jgi:large subunit ribosomal protein LP2
MIFDGLSRMKFVAAYLLAVLAGNASPSAEDLTAILESGNFI